MFGDLIPRNDKYWELYVQLMRLLDVVMCSVFRPEIITYLQYLVSTICEMYTTLFSQNLKPKFHNLLHYHRAMLRFGPLRYISSMRFEAKHRPNKLASKSSANRVNMTLSIAKRHQLILNDVFLRNTLKKYISYGTQNKIPLRVASLLSQTFQWITVDDMKSVSWVKISSSHFHRDAVIVNRIEPDNIHFAIILSVYVYKEDQIVFEVSPLHTVGFDEHYFAYCVQDTPEDVTMMYVNYSTMQYKYVCNLINMSFGGLTLKYVILRKPL